MNVTTRREVLAAADAMLKANPPEKTTTFRVRYRGGRSALNWLRKNDAHGAKALWQIASTRLPTAANDNIPAAANDNNADAKGLGVDRCKDGKPRGKNPDRRSIEAYLALPPVQPRLGDPEPWPARTGSWDGASRGITIKPQREELDFHPFMPLWLPGAGNRTGRFLPRIGRWPWTT